MAIKTILFLFIILCLGKNINAQETIELTYESFFVNEGSSLFRLKKNHSKHKTYWNTIVSNDTAFTFVGDGKKGKYRHLKNGYYPDTILHHSAYYASETNNLFETSAFKGNYFISHNEIPSPKNYWMDTTKTILGYECQAAMVFSTDGDSSTMWIARNMKSGLITFHHGFVVPGVAMEALNLKYGLYYKAVKIEKTNNQIYFPKDYPQVSLEEFRKRKK